MAETGTDGRRRGEARPELKDLVDGTGVLPRRATPGTARAVLDADGVVLVPGGGPDPEAMVALAATALGGRLRELFGVRPQGGTDSPVLGLHNDGAHLEADVHGRTVRLRDPDEDYLLMHCTAPAPSGGDSVLVDGYALVDRLAAEHPGLHAFLTGCDVDFFGGRTHPPRGVPPTPLLRRLVEHTRAGGARSGPATTPCRCRGSRGRPSTWPGSRSTPTCSRPPPRRRPGSGSSPATCCCWTTTGSCTAGTRSAAPARCTCSRCARWTRSGREPQSIVNGS